MEDQKQLTKDTISGKVDGLLQYQINLPFAETSYPEFSMAMKSIEVTDIQQVLLDLKDHFSEKKNHKWTMPEDGVIRIDDLFRTSLFED